MTIVSSSGNGNPGCQVSNPALGKNVIAVGSVDQLNNWNNMDPPIANPVDCSLLVSPDDPMDGPHQVSAFSCPGAFFGATPGLHQVQVKPDLVAPGWRVEGARPDPIPCQSGLCDEVAADTTYSYARGTSFSAPAVAGAAAVLTKQFREREQIEPRPSLLKAALIATADSLGPTVNGVQTCTNGDCRPSPAYGWGLVNLNRATDETPRWVVNETVAFDEAGQGWVSPTLRAAEKGKPVLIVLAWSDLNTFISPALRRDLDLGVSTFNSPWFVGNNFNENTGGADDGWSKVYGFFPNQLDDDTNTVEAVFIAPAGVTYSGMGSGFQVSVGIETLEDANVAPFQTQSFSLFVWNAVCDSGGC
jgi:subtilisin family serine protease